MSTAELAGLRVLIIDDNEDAAESVAWLLADADAETRVVNDAVHITDLMREFDPALILLDLSLPKVDGYQACRLIRQSHGATPYVAALTGWADAEHQSLCHRAGFDLHVTKPIGIDALIAIGRIALQRTRA